MISLLLMQSTMLLYIERTSFMANVQILDCTLRDGGYINDFNFGCSTITDIIEKLGDAKIDIIECGFLISGKDNPHLSLFSTVQAVAPHLKNKNSNSLYVAMIAYGDIPNEDIVPYDGSSIDGIRITFHEHEIEPAITLGRQLMEKGYKVFMQPVGTTTYDDKGLLELIEKINQLKPFAFYLVDTLGVLYKNDLLRLFYLIDHNLAKDIHLGFHSHNNLQLSFSNAQELLLLHSKRNIILDSSVFGMGRGVGNLCTELITQYINDNIEDRYQVLSVLEIMDSYINPLCNQYKWGYAVPYFLSSSSKCHPNYAAHLLNKETISIKDIYAILHHMPLEKRALYDKHFIEKTYQKYLQHTIDDRETCHTLEEQLRGKEILILAPGPSVRNYETQIQNYILEKGPVVISVNFIPESIKPTYLFVSNMKRFHQLDHLADMEETKVIITSNITAGDSKYLRVNYASYLNESEVVSDNSGLMLLNLLRKLGVTNVELAGFDGFSMQTADKYYNEQFISSFDWEAGKEKTAAVKEQIKKLSSLIAIHFLTPTQYE